MLIRNKPWFAFYVDPCAMVRWRALLLKSLCSQLFRSSSCINSQAKELVRLPLGPAGLDHRHREVCGIFEEPSDQAGAEAEKPSAASEVFNT